MNIINMSKEYFEKVVIDNPIGNLYRKNHVLILLVTDSGSFILGKKKNFYPDHIARMLGGGVDEGEDPLLAAQREIKEELQIEISTDEFWSLCTVTTQAQTSEGPMEMKTHIYAVTLDNADSAKPSDDISGIEIYTPQQYVILVDQMRDLTGEYVTDKYSFKWSDWGKVYAPIHRLALDEYNKS
jgi:8-oxo-dGTP pyrophosphatase MutT (NUDIX family)